MRGKAVAFGAVSIVNALAGGKGATLGVRLSTEAQVRLDEGRGPWEVTANGKKVDPGLAVESAKKALSALGEAPGEYHGKIETRHTMPIGVGLKSSSSSSVAIPLAVADALGRRSLAQNAVLRCSVDASLSSRCSITGAYDDAASCLLGGINAADNLRVRLVAPTRRVKRLTVLIKVGKEGSRRKLMDIERIRKFGPVADSIFALSLGGRPWAAMSLNGLLYSRLLGYDPAPAVQALELGATGAGLSGTGPAVAAVFDVGNGADPGELRDRWSTDGSSVIQTQTNNERGGPIA